MNRETWLNALAALMAPRFQELGFPVPQFRVSVGFTSKGKSTKVGAECWHSKSSGDGKFEIFIGPQVNSSMDAAAYLAHELSHAAAGFKHKHRGAFAKLMKSLGMLAPMTQSNAGDVFKAWVQPFLDQLGELPHAALRWGAAMPRVEGEGGEDGDGDEAADGGSSNDKPKQKARLLKCICNKEGCGYTVRVTQKWLDVGPPHCPMHGAMDTDGSDGA